MNSYSKGIDEAQSLRAGEYVPSTNRLVLALSWGGRISQDLRFAGQETLSGSTGGPWLGAMRSRFMYRNNTEIGRGYWTFFGSDTGAKTAAVLRSFVASCRRCGVEPFAWFHDVLSRIPAHSITRLSELLPHRWLPATTPARC